MCNHVLVSSKGALSPPYFLSIYLNDVDSLAEGVQGVITGIINFTVMHACCMPMIFPLHLLITMSYRLCLTN
jgi:hypothetical protein